MTVRQLAFGGGIFWEKRIYHNELVENMRFRAGPGPGLLGSFPAGRERSRSFRSAPALIHIDFDDISEGGVYDWTGVKSFSP